MGYFKGRNFRDFAIFWQNSESWTPRQILKHSVCESLLSRNILINSREKKKNNIFTNFFELDRTTVKGKHIVEIGWGAAGITDAIRLGSKNLPAIDPFHDIDPFLDENTAESQQLQTICGLTLAENS